MKLTKFNDLNSKLERYQRHIAKYYKTLLNSCIILLPLVALSKILLALLFLIL